MNNINDYEIIYNDEYNNFNKNEQDIVMRKKGEENTEEEQLLMQKQKEDFPLPPSSHTRMCARKSKLSELRRLLLLKSFFEKKRAKVLTKHQQYCNFATPKLLFYHFKHHFYHERHEI